MSSYLGYAGLFWLSILGVKSLRFLYLHLRPSSLPRYAYKKGDEQPWAFVTGSSDGIGLGFAHELARSGFNIIIHGRNPTKLEDRRKALSLEYPRSEIRVIVADVCDNGQILSRIDSIVQELRELHLTVLVNNVGGPPPGMEPLYKPLEASTAKDIEGMIDMNIRFTAHLTRCVIPLLTRNQQPGLIVNTGSMAEIGLPWLSMYSGAKAFISTWSTSLARELKADKKDLEVLTIVPVTVTDVSFRKEPPSLAQPDIRTFARASLQKVGCGRNVVTGYWVHGLMATIVDSLPESVRLNMLADSVRAEAEKDKKRD
jgi:17beta-estradiol 17-dehydrogenase / very-long-chain 3-oxoacyl-CoA reductase